MLREHDNHVPSVDGYDKTSHSLISFLDRVDAHDRSLFTEGLDITLAKHPIEKPPGIVGQLYDAREDTAASPIIDALWTLQGAAPLVTVANRSGMFPNEVQELVGNRMPEIIQLTTAADLEGPQPENSNIAAIIRGVQEGTILPDQQVVVSRPICHFYSEHQELVAD